MEGSYPAPRQLMEQLFVKALVGFFGAHREENVAPDELVDDFAVSRQAVEDDVALLVLDHHVFYLPVHVPRLNKTLRC